jgi:hypothetical protein
MAKKKNDSKSKSEIREKINQIYEENELANLISNKNRARSITIGTALGGVVEISMRGDYHDLWLIMQPVEVIELIEQLAAGIGIQIAMRPKQDFAAWRGWDVESDDRYWAGAAPWQIEDSSYNHKKFLKDSREGSKLLSGSEEMDKKTKKEILIQEKIRKEIQKEVSKNINQLRDELGVDFDEISQNVREELDNMKNTNSEKDE